MDSAAVTGTNLTLRAVGCFTVILVATGCHGPPADPPRAAPPPPAPSASPPSSTSPRAAASVPAIVPLPVRFEVSKSYDKTRIFGMLHIDDPAGLESRARDMGVDVAFARRVRRAKSFTEVEKELDRLVEERHKAHHDAIQAAHAQFVSLWSDLGPVLSQVVTEITEHAWFYPEYHCVVSAFHRGISDWHGNRVAVGYDLHLVQKKRILSHEIVLSHVFHLVRKTHSKQELQDAKVWAFSEITAVLILDDSRLRAHWPSMPRAGKYFVKSNYPHLHQLEGEFKTHFDKRRSFSGYLEKALPALQSSGI